MANDIKCPNCGNVFDVENVLAADIEIKYQQQYQEKLQQSLGKIEQDKKKLEEEQQQFEEKKKKENEIFAQKLQQERLKIETEVQEQLRKSISADYENKLRILEESNKDNEEKLKEARRKELEFLQKEQVLQNKEAELGTYLTKKTASRKNNNLAEQIRSQEIEKNALKETAFQLQVKRITIATG